jgi:NAD-dependent DNA ligase
MSTFSELKPIKFDESMIDPETLIDYASTLSETNFKGLITFLCSQYHNHCGLIDDDLYDDLKDVFEAKYGEYNHVGAEPKGKKVKLPYYLPSLRKIKTNKEIQRYCEAYPGPYFVEDKVDGLTILDHKEDNKIALFTRGNGIYGTDVSHLAPHLNFPNIDIASGLATRYPSDISIRGELVMFNAVFDELKAEYEKELELHPELAKKKQKKYRSARNLASGSVGAKKSFDKDRVSKLNYMAFHIMDTPVALTPEEELQKLSQLGFETPGGKVFHEINKEILTEYYKQRLLEVPYKMDGLVIYQNRAIPYPKDEMPRHVIAFKTGSQKAVTKVLHVGWEASGNRLLKPVIHYETVELCDAECSNATAHNARYIIQHNIGPGAKVLVTRSGDTIPKILSVIEPSQEDCYPDPEIYGAYDWNENKVELVLKEDNNTVRTNRIRNALKVLEVKNVSKKRIRILVDDGIETLSDLIRASVERMSPLIGPTVSSKLYHDLHEALTHIPLARIMKASGLFPRIGESSFTKIFDEYYDLIVPESDEYERCILREKDNDKLVSMIQGISGFDQSAYTIVHRLPLFIDWVNAHPNISIQYPEKKIIITNKANRLTGQVIVFSGFRDKGLEAQIMNEGGRVGSGDVNGKTTLLVLKNVNDMKGKAEKAIKFGIPMMGRAEFEKKYGF